MKTNIEGGKYSAPTIDAVNEVHRLRRLTELAAEQAIDMPIAFLSGPNEQRERALVAQEKPNSVEYQQVMAYMREHYPLLDPATPLYESVLLAHHYNFRRKPWDQHVIAASFKNFQR